MLPSTFMEKQMEQPALKRKLKAKQELVEFFQEMIVERTRQVLEESANPKSRDRALALGEFQEKLLEKAKEEAQAQENAEGLPPGEKRNTRANSAGSEADVNPFLSLKETLKYSKLFKDEFKLEKLPTKALLVVCNLLGLQPYGIRANIILQLRYHLLHLQKEDREILWEGVESLTHEELVDACRDRAMRFYGVSDDAMRDQMRRWLELSSHPDIPPLLLLWSRSITMTHAPLARTVLAEESTAASSPAAPPPPCSEVIIDPAEPLTETPTLEELLPLVDGDPVRDTTLGQCDEASHKLKEDVLQARLELADQRLAQLQSAAEALRKEQKFAEKKSEKVGLTGAAGISRSDAEPESVDVEDDLPELATSVDGAKEQRVVLVQKVERLEKELDILRNAMAKQDDHTAEVLQSLTALVNTYHQLQGDGSATVQNLAEIISGLEKVLADFEAAVNEVSSMMDGARVINLSGHGKSEDLLYEAPDVTLPYETAYSSSDERPRNPAEADISTTETLDK